MVIANHCEEREMGSYYLRGMKKFSKLAAQLSGYT